MVDPKHKFKQHVFSNILNTIHLILCHMLSLNLCNYEWLLCLSMISLYQQRAVRRTAHISTLQKKALLPTMMDSSRFTNIPSEALKVSNNEKEWKSIFWTRRKRTRNQIIFRMFMDCGMHDFSVLMKMPWSYQFAYHEYPIVGIGSSVDFVSFFDVIHQSFYHWS